MTQTPTQTPPTQTLLTVKTVQQWTQLSRTTIYRLTVSGHLHPVRFRRDEVAELMQNGVTTIADNLAP
jgi:predicted DNA-binding transcriptional regulator AlpA